MLFDHILDEGSGSGVRDQRYERVGATLGNATRKTRDGQKVVFQSFQILLQNQCHQEGIFIGPFPLLDELLN